MAVHLASRLQIIDNDGDCFYSSVLYSLKHHPTGNLVKKFDLKDTVKSLRKMVADSPGFVEEYRKLYYFLTKADEDEIEETYGIAENFRENNKGQMKLNKNGNIAFRINFPAPWISDYYMEKKDTEGDSLANFLAEAKARVKGDSPYNRKPEYACEFEVTILTNYLKSFNIELRLQMPDYDVGSELFFGTNEEPIINVLYNGLDHYNSLVHRTFGGTRRRREKKRKTRAKRRY